MENINERLCLACGEIHNDKECPLMKKKLEKCLNSSKRNFLMGNILLECIRKKVDVYQILCEIAEYIEQKYDVISHSHIFSIDFFVEYFATSLNCSSSTFFRNPKITSEEYSKLIKIDTYSSILGTMCDDNNSVYSIDLGCSVSDYECTASNVYGLCLSLNDEYEFELCKELYKDNDWEYNLYIHLPDGIKSYPAKPIAKSQYPNGRYYNWESLGCTSWGSILLVSEKHGALERLFEKELDTVWYCDNFTIKFPFDDMRFNSWMQKLEDATQRGLLKWHPSFSGRHFYTSYDYTEIEIDPNGLCVRIGAGKTGLRFENKIEFNESDEIDADLLVLRSNNPLKSDEDTDSSEKNPRILSLIENIEKSIIKQREKINHSKLPTKQLGYTAVIVGTNSMVCNNNEHYITPMRGIVKLLNNDNYEIDYEIYVGFCSTCNKYYAFINDFNEMLATGKPLCSVFYANKESDNETHIPFRYKSQSVLNAMGYTVEKNTALTTEARQKIITEALSKDLFDIHDVLRFLNWLVKTRETQPKYKNAVIKWKEDIKFVTEYQKNKREFANVDSIIVK